MDDEILVFEEEVNMMREEEDIPPSLSLGDNDPSEDNDNPKVNSTVPGNNNPGTALCGNGFDLCVVPEGGNWATGHVTEPVLGSSLDLINTDGLGSRATFEREEEGDKIQVDEA